MLVILIFLSMSTAIISGFQPIMLAPILNIEDAGKIQPAQTIGEISLNNIGPTIAHIIYNSNNSNKNIEVAYISIILFFLCSSIASALSYAAHILSTWITLRVKTDLQKDLYRHLVSLDIDFFIKSRSGELVNRFIQDAEEVTSAIDAAVRMGLQAIFLLLIYGAWLVRTSPRLAFATVSVGLIHMVLNRLIGRRLRDAATAYFDDNGSLVSLLGETISGIRSIKVSVTEPFFIKKLDTAIQKSMNTFFYFSNIKHFDVPIRAITDALALSVVLALAITDYSAGKLDFSGLAMFMVVARFTIAPISTLAQAANIFQLGVGASVRIREILNIKPILIGGKEEKPYFDNSIELVDIFFSYEDKPCLSNINLTIKRGETIAIVGESGAGKSTLVDIITRMRIPTSGKYIIDYKDANCLSLESLRRLFGVVPQEPTLFNDSILNNISLGRRDLEDSSVEKYLRISNASEFIELMSLGSNTIIGDRGVRLSGGQKQRISIARALYALPQIIVLDEATSALDSLTENIIQNELYALLKDKTFIVVAHRLSSIKRADKIVVLRDGNIVGMDTHDRLMEFDEYYKSLYQAQFILDQ